MAHEEAMTDGERCVWCFLFDNGFALRIPPHEFLGFQPSQSVRETAEVRTNPASGDRPDTVTHTPGLGTSASKRADTLLPLWCLLGPFQPSVFARETAVAVMPNPLCAGSAGCSENGATPASKRADTLLPLWCLPALVPP